MLSHFRKGKDTRYVKNHGFSVHCAKDKVAQEDLGVLTVVGFAQGLNNVLYT